jgi:hypothetical protein
MKTLILFLAATLAVMAQTTQDVQAAMGKAPTVQLAPRAVVTTSNMLYESVVTADAPVTIPPGDFKILDTQLDYSGAKRVAIAVQSAFDLTPLQIEPGWAGSGMFFTPTDLSASGAFTTLGGMTTPVYGSFLKLALINNSSRALPIKQVTVYAVRTN